jgi:hypothetical protein
MLVELERRLDARPAWAHRLEARARARWAADPVARRRALTTAAVVWQLGDLVMPRRLVPGIRTVLLAMIVFDSIATWVWVNVGIATEGNPLVASLMDRFGDGIGLALRTVWSVALVLALAWLAERRAMARPALAFLVLVLGSVTLIHALAVGWLWSRLLALG